MSLAYSAEQLAAIEAVTRSDEDPAAVRCAVLTGNPGTGKTAVSEEVVARWRDLWGRESVATLCPTGKAARRFTELTGYPALTIHRALIPWEEANPDTPAGLPPLESLRGLIVDEASMVDQYLAQRLLDILPAGVRLLLVGDADQLPSVGPGAVLRDIIASGRVPVYRLTQVYRQSERSWIAMNAQRINRGERPLAPVDSEDYFETVCEQPEQVLTEIARVVRANPDTQVLVPIYRGPIGANVINDLVRSIVNPDRGQPSFGPEGRFRVGDRVIHKKNNYQLSTFNGEVGRVVQVGERILDDRPVPTMLVDYDGRVVPYDWQTAVEQLRQAWALTIHSAQGSQWSAVAVVVHASHGHFLSRQLFYTAVSRAQKRLTVITDRRGVEMAVRRNTDRTRRTLLAERIREAA